LILNVFHQFEDFDAFLKISRVLLPQSFDCRINLDLALLDFFVFCSEKLFGDNAF